VQDLTAKLADLTRRHAQMSEKFRPEWPEMVRLQREIDETRERIASERQALYSQVLGAAESAYRASRNEEAFLRGALEEAKRQSQEQSLKEIRYNNLKAEVANRRATLEALLKRQGETASSAGVSEQAAGNIRVVDTAETPLKPSSPNLPVNLALGILVGLTLGVGLAFFLDYVDKSVKTTEEMAEAMDVPSIGLIPAERQPGARLWLVKSGGPHGVRLQVVRTPADPAQNRSSIELVSHEDPKSKLSEAFRELRTALLVSKAGGPPRAILITSTQPGEGKTVVAVNLAITLAQIGRRVLLVDADLRKPRLHKLFEIDGTPGLSHYLSGTGPLRTQPCRTSVSGLDLIPSGPLPPNPADLLDSERFVQIQRDLELQGYDHIVYDSPPVLAVADPSIIAGRVETVVMVVQAGVTARDALRHATHRLQQVKAKIVGGVLNRVDLTQQGYYGYSYKRYYGSGEARITARRTVTSA
jgi:capsular exopolysaccharide synthesis family protein